MTVRFFAHSIESASGHVALSREEAHHLSRVLRLQVGDDVIVFDAAGREFHAVIESISSHGATLALGTALVKRRMPTREVTVAVSPLRPEAMSWLVQKLTEIGVARMAPFVSQRTALPKAGDQESDESRRRRWERISLAACKQCGRARALEILPTLKFHDQLSALDRDDALKMLAWEGGDAQSLAGVLTRPQLDRHAPAVLCIGPEGGFTRPEYQAALEIGYVPVDLGPNILRAETAAIAAASIVLAMQSMG